MTTDEQKLNEDAAMGCMAAGFFLLLGGIMGFILAKLI